MCVGILSSVQSSVVMEFCCLSPRQVLLTLLISSVQGVFHCVLVAVHILSIDTSLKSWIKLGMLNAFVAKIVKFSSRRSVILKEVKYFAKMTSQGEKNPNSECHCYEHERMCKDVWHTF